VGYARALYMEYCLCPRCYRYMDFIRKKKHITRDYGYRRLRLAEKGKLLPDHGCKFDLSESVINIQGGR
jgi:predicted DCC family thiol-disulfide oxidoreductase YuxK